MEGGKFLFLSHYTTHSGSMSDFSNLEGAVGLGDCDGALDNGSVVSGSDCEVRDSDGVL